MRRIVLFLFLGLLAASILVIGVASAQAPGNAAGASNLEKPIRNCEQQVSGWRRAEAVEITFLIITFALGAVIAALQKLETPAAKNATIVLGIVTAILTGVNGTVFPADVKTLRRAVSDGNAVIGQLYIKLEPLQSRQLSGADLKAATDDFAKELSRFQTVADTMTGSTIQTKMSWNVTPGVLPVVYAQSASSLPAWTRNPPAGSGNEKFFVGKAVDPSLAVAKQNSTDAALYKAAQALIPLAPNASRSAVLDLIKASAVTQDSAFAYDGNKKSYAYYTLLRLTPEIQDVIKTLPGAPATPLNVFRTRDSQPADLTSNPSAGLFLLDKAGAVSKLIPNQQGSGDVQRLFQIPRSFSVYAITATADTVFAAAGSRLGCTVYKYSLASRTTTSLLLAIRERCVGVADDGSNLYLTFPERREIRYWDKWDASSSHTWTLNNV